MPNLARRTVTLALTGLALAASLTGCGSSGPDGPAFRVPSPSMEPSFTVGQTVQTNTPEDLHVGQVVIFIPPKGATSDTCGDPDEGRGTDRMCTVPTRGQYQQPYIKRIAAGPGDRISMRNGTLVRNGKPAQEPYVKKCGVGGDCTFSEEVTVPDGHWFMLGDNRGESDDSRFWGPVPTVWIQGVVDDGGA